MSYVTNTFDDQLVEIIKSGGAGFLPADTMYGLSCRALDGQAVEKINQLKSRDATKPFIVLISNLDQLKELGAEAAGVERLIEKYWPGPLTIVLPAAAAPAWLRKQEISLAVRFPDDKNLNGLMARTGPIVSTSANLSGQPPITSVKDAQEFFGEQLDFYVDTGPHPGLPSTIVKMTDGQLEILRQGAVKINP